MFYKLDCLTYRGDFSMQFNPDGDEERTSSVFNIMEQACMELAEVSYKLHNSSIVDAPPLSNGHRPLFKNFLYSRMLWGESWTILYINCCSQC